MNFADRLRETMAEKGLNQSQLAARVGVNKATVSLWLNSTTQELKGDNLVRLARALGLTERWLQSGFHPKYPSTVSAPVSGLQDTLNNDLWKNFNVTERSDIRREGYAVHHIPVIPAKVDEAGCYMEGGTFMPDDIKITMYLLWLTKDPSTYSLQISGLSPVIPEGWILVVSPDRIPEPLEYVVVSVIHGRKMIRRFVAEHKGEVLLQEMHRLDRVREERISKLEIEYIHPAIGLCPPGMIESIR